jgi:four helix bundle protein
MRDYTRIKAYQRADDLAIEVYRLTKTFPTEERYGLTAQIRRAAVSGPANIAEGASRQHKRDYLQFLYMARGSVIEVGYLLHLAHRLEYVGLNIFDRADARYKEAIRTLSGLIFSVEKEV